MQGCTERIYTIEFNLTELLSLDELLGLIGSPIKKLELETFCIKLKELVKSLLDPPDD